MARSGRTVNPHAGPFPTGKGAGQPSPVGRGLSEGAPSAPTLARRTFLAALAAGCAPAPSIEAAPRSDAGLEAFHAALAALKSGRRKDVAVLQFGDSHTANDSFSGRVRELFQARYGDAGRGLLPPGVPHDWYRPSGVTVTASGWQRVAGPGLAPFRQHADGGATIDIRADGPEGCAIVAVDAIQGQGGGTVELLSDTGRSVLLSTRDAGRITARFPGAAAVSIRARGDGPVDLLGVTLGTGRSGVTWSNLGFPGATVGITARWDPAIVARQAAALDPELLVLAFGTNEAFKDSTDLPEYRALFTARLAAMRALAPAASALVVLPPDGVRRGLPGCPGGWGNPPLLPAIRRVQAEAARAAGAAVWDWSAAMGGACGITSMMRTEPPAAAPDGVHMFKPGYRATAESLFEYLTRV